MKASACPRPHTPSAPYRTESSAAAELADSLLVDEQKTSTRCLCRRYSALRHATEVSTWSGRGALAEKQDVLVCYGAGGDADSGNSALSCSSLALVHVLQ